MPDSESPEREALGKLLSRAGHDVRGPAGVVTGVLDELEHALGAENASANSALFTMARRGVRRLLRLADRYTVLSELEKQPELSAQAIDLRALVQAAVDEASFVYGRRGVNIAQELLPLSGVASARWMTAAITDATMLVLRLARAQVTVQLEKQRNAARIVVASDKGAEVLENAWGAAIAGPELSEESALPIQVVAGVLKAHGGAARIERASDGAGVLIVLEWPFDAGTHARTHSGTHSGTQEKSG